MKKSIFFSLFLLLTGAIYAQDFKFAVITDIHITPNDSLAYNDLMRAVNQINKTPDLAFVLITGDITENGDRASLLRAKKALDSLEHPYYAVSGNHETKWSESGATDFGHIFGSERFQFEHNGYRFLGFATGPIIRMMDGHVAPQDIQWLNDELKKNPQQPTLLITHYPLLPEDVDNWYEVTDAVRSFNVKAFIGGHYHANRLTSYDGIPGFLCRSSLRAKEKVGGYSVFDIRNDSILVYEQKIGEEMSYWGGYSLAPNHYYTADNSGYPRPDFSINKEYPQVTEAWVVENGNSIYASPICHKNRIYVGDDSGVMTCYSVKNGKKLWEYQTENRIIGTPAIADNILVFGSADKNIYGLDAKKGSVKWTFSTQEAVLGAVTIEKGIAYIGASDKTFRAIDIKTGKLIWLYNKIKGYIEARPLLYDNKVIFGAWDSYLYALDQKTGELAWKWQEKERMHYSPAAVWPVGTDGKIFFTAPDRYMTALDAKTGEIIWRTNDYTVRETIALSEDQNRVYSKTMQDKVVCYATKEDTPQLIWATDVQYGYDHAPSMPAEKEGVVYGSTKNGIIFAIEGETGRLLWKHKIGNSIINTVYPLSKKECLFTSGDGKVGLLRIQ